MRDERRQPLIMTLTAALVFEPVLFRTLRGLASICLRDFRPIWRSNDCASQRQLQRHACWRARSALPVSSAIARPQDKM